MKLSKEIPQVIPMHGKKIRLYYRGIIKRCSNCFGAHQRKNCKSEKVPWVAYVEQFTNAYPEIPREFYGRWASMVDGQRSDKAGDQTIRAKTETTINHAGELATQMESRGKITEETKSESEKSTSQVEDQTKRTNGNKNEISNENKKKIETKNKNESGNKNENKNKKGEPTKEEINQLVKGLIASGISAKMLEERFKAGKKETNTRQRGLSLGRGRGKVRGKDT